MSLILRYSDTKNGGISFIGNTLGLSKRQDQNLSGTLGSIGAFTSLNNTLQVNTFPLGTTSNYQQNGSFAVLSIPSDSKILYAELIWGGLYKSRTDDISSLLNNTINFTTPLSTSTISSDISTRQNLLITIDNNTLGFYVRTANVTNLVANSLNGNYSVSGVPALINPLESQTNSTNHAGWTLAVVYENQSLPLRNLTLWSGGVVVSPATGSTDISISGFITPPALPITGKIFVSSAEGDAVISGDQMLFGSTTNTLSNLFGPNNPVSNFFASQINDDNGILKTSGTFGTRNANAISGTNTTACRQGWNITSVDVSNKLVANQKTAAIRFLTDQDLYVPNALALQVDSLGANLTLTKIVDKNNAKVGEKIEFTIIIKNIGSLPTTTSSLNDIFPSNFSLVENSITINGITQPNTTPINIGVINPNETKTVVFKMIANSLPNINPYFNIATVNYTFTPFEGLTVSSFSNSNYTSTFFYQIKLNVNKSVDKIYAIKNDTLTYSSEITNESNLPLINLFFQDSIPQGTTFIPNTVKIDNISYLSYSPETGFFIPNLIPQQSTKIEFKVIVN